MGYKTYTTEALVCGSRNSFTSDKSYLLFTHDAGMLWATARSVRVEKSKQRYALQDFSIIRASLIKGKGGWRIGSVEALGNPFMESESQRGRAGISVVVKLLRRFVHGEDPHPTIYKDAALVLSCIAVADEEDCIDLQNQFTLRTLYSLGYVAPHESYKDLIEAKDPWSVPQKISKDGERAIELALSVSHL
ncbi:recombination protein O N-terminal domain-containing protein [Candidatus Pacebacteria bacterium]|nr:recombination protein O N-terminal domain-containing protein [Candidatus Paceibacterota bacterium]